MPRAINRAENESAANRFWNRGEIAEYTGRVLSGYSIPCFECRYLSGTNRGEIFVTFVPRVEKIKGGIASEIEGW